MKTHESLMFAYSLPLGEVVQFGVGPVTDLFPHHRIAHLEWSPRQRELNFPGLLNAKQ